MILKNFKQGFISISLAIGVLFSMPFISSAWTKISTTNQIYRQVEEVPQKEMGLVLGAAAYGDKLSDILRDRVDTSIELYKKEKISVIIMSGAENEVKAMKKYAITKGIPEKAVVQDPKGINTFASIKNISNLDKSITIITQKYHLPRAIFIANHFGIETIGVMADKRAYFKMNDFMNREILATTKAMLNLLIMN